MMKNDAVDAALAQWAVERPELETGPMGLLGRLARSAQLAAAETQTFLARHDLLAWEFDVLATLRRSRAGGPLTSGDLARMTMVGSAATTRRVDRLVERGLIERQVNPASRREVLVALTAEGARVVEDVLDGHVANQHRIVAGLSESEQEALSALLRTLQSSLGD